MLRLLGCLAAAFCLLMSPGMARAQAQQPSRLDDIIKRGTLRVGMTGDYLPFSSLDKATGAFRGFDVDMAEMLGKALGVKVDYVKTACAKARRRSRAAPILENSRPSPTSIIQESA